MNIGDCTMKFSEENLTMLLPVGFSCPKNVSSTILVLFDNLKAFPSYVLVGMVQKTDYLLFLPL